MEGGLCLELGEVDDTADVEADPDQGNEEHEGPLEHKLGEAGHADAVRVIDSNGSHIPSYTLIF